MKKSAILIASACAALLSAAHVPAFASDALDEERIRAIVLEEIARNPAAILSSLDAHMREQQAAEARAADEQVVSRRGEVVPSSDSGFAFLGNPEGTVEIVYLFDVNCGFCKRLSPELARLVEENPDVKVWHRDFPILAPSSQLAAYAGGVVWEKWPERYEEVYRGFVGFQGSLSQDDVKEILVEILGESDADEVWAWIEDYERGSPVRPVNARVQETLALARLMGVSGTPFVYVPQGDGIMRGAPEDAYARLTAMVERARSVAE